MAMLWRMSAFRNVGRAPSAWSAIKISPELAMSETIVQAQHAKTPRRRA